MAPVVLRGKIVGAVEVFRDITKEKEIDKAKTEFVSLASHQLRTPLSTVSWYSEMLLAGDAGEVTPDQKKYLEEIYRGNQRMVDLVNTLLDVSRIEMGTFMVEPKPTDIVKLAKSVIDEQKLQISEKKLKFSSSFGNYIPLVRVDPKLLRMVIQNLLSNAIKYSPDGGKIEVAIFMEDKKNVLLTVADAGYGIPKNQQDRIFTKLFRADNVIGKDTEGTGLGLYIAKSIVEQAKGKISFDSIENKGTTFYVTLPIGGVKKLNSTYGTLS
jgi:signal transduction histidine kinase